MVSVAFKYVPQPTAKTLTFSSVFILLLWWHTNMWKIVINCVFSVFMCRGNTEFFSPAQQHYPEQHAPE